MRESLFDQAFLDEKIILDSARPREMHLALPVLRVELYLLGLSGH